MQLSFNQTTILSETLYSIYIPRQLVVYKFQDLPIWSVTKFKNAAILKLNADNQKFAVIVAETTTFYYFIQIALDKAGLCVLLDLPCSEEWHRFSMPTVMYTSISPDTIGQCSMYIVSNLAVCDMC